MNIFHRHSKFSVKPVVEISHEVARTAVWALPRSNFALFVSVFVKEEYVNVFSAYFVFVKVFNHADKHCIFRARKNNYEFFVFNCRHSYSLE